MEYTSTSEAQTTEIAKKTAKKLQNGGLLYLIGNLGCGKTHFTKGLASAFGIDNFQIKSPTYTYIRKYQLEKQNLYHIDLYRLEQIDELLLQEIIEITENPNNVIIIEWADRIKNYIDLEAITINFEYIDTNSRKITISDE